MFNLVGTKRSDKLIIERKYRNLRSRKEKFYKDVRENTWSSPTEQKGHESGGFPKHVHILMCIIITYTWVQDMRDLCVNYIFADEVNKVVEVIVILSITTLYHYVLLGPSLDFTIVNYYSVTIVGRTYTSFIVSSTWRIKNSSMMIQYTKSLIKLYSLQNRDFLKWIGSMG